MRFCFQAQSGTLLTCTAITFFSSGLSSGSLKGQDPNLISGLHTSFSHSLSGAVHATESSEVLATRISTATKGGPFTSLTARAAFVRLLYAQLLPLPSQRNLQTRMSRVEAANACYGFAEGATTEQRPKPLHSPKQTEAQGTKENTEERGFIETKTFCVSKDTIKKVKRQSAEQEKMLAREGSVSRIHKELPLNNTHTHKTTKKGAKDSNILQTRHPPSHQACEEMLGSETPALPRGGHD